MKITTVALDPVEVLFVEAVGGLAGAQEAFATLERGLASLRGRRFYGVYSCDGSYRACMARRPEDDPDAMGLESWVIPGGTYARTRLLDWTERLPEIGHAFDAMAAAHEADPARPSIEYYRSGRELVLLLPIRPAGAG
jgi:hypothetical protein